MRVGRFELGGRYLWGAVAGEEVQFLMGPAEGSEQTMAGAVPLGDVRWLAPVIPTKVVAVGLNYRDHAEELGMPVPDEPVLFMKPSTAVVGPGDFIRTPPDAGQIDYEGELAVVIGKPAFRAKAEDAAEYILGYTCGNDVTARDIQKKDGQWTRAKTFDTFCPLGPWIETDLDPSVLSIETLVDGKVKQSSDTGQMVFGVPRLLEFISNVMTLLPGDVILTGTPPGVGPVENGETVVVRIEGIGDLANPVGARLEEAAPVAETPLPPE
jgi:2-keto-4-pentenoate hydratase/2-oxohepta-3-ene-1,7-dioic acid hydratase in catechol pathway